MFSICDDLRRLDSILLLLTREFSETRKFSHNLQPHALLCSARRRVHSLEKKARALHMLEAAYWCPLPPANSSGGAPPMIFYAYALPIALKPENETLLHFATYQQQSYTEEICYVQ